MSLGALFTAFRVTEAIEVNLINLMISHTRFTRGYGGLRLHAHNFFSCLSKTSSKMLKTGVCFEFLRVENRDVVNTSLSFTS